MDRGRPCGKLLTSHLARNLRRHSRRRGSIGRQPMARVFLADCQPLFNEALEALIARDGRNEVVGQACTASQVSESVVHLKPDLVVLDGEGVVPRAMLPELFRRLIDLGDRASDTPLSRLSPREREVLALLGRGWSNSRIGDELFISPHTVRTHVQNILQKLEMHSKLEAATFAMQHELPSRRVSGDVAKLTSRRQRSRSARSQAADTTEEEAGSSADDEPSSSAKDAPPTAS